MLVIFVLSRKLKLLEIRWYFWILLCSFIVVENFVKMFMEVFVRVILININIVVLSFFGLMLVW